ncbi:hypothetical protein MHA_2681 [Mannheimia haemolytica PHL213]|nr:hypothetical protein MHA_2681 [Mannheimia haemolytica PHL213]
MVSFSKNQSFFPDEMYRNVIICLYFNQKTIFRTLFNQIDIPFPIFRKIAKISKI